MSIFGFLLPKRQPTAAAAKDRLQILLAHERSTRDAPDFLPALQRELVAVIRKYIQVGDDKVAIKLERQRDLSVLEVNIELPRPN